MTRTRQAISISVASMVLAFFMAGVSDSLFAQDRSINIPENAIAISYGKGWKCKQGYRPMEDVCNAIEVPENAYPTNVAYGRGWKCNWGYRQVSEACVFINAPANAYVTHSGTKWKCNRGYRADGNACVTIDVPKNAYLTEASYGPGWKCERGYHAVETKCVAIQLPDNAHLDFSGKDWACNQPYKKHNDKCTAP